MEINLRNHESEQDIWRKKIAILRTPSVSDREHGRQLGLRGNLLVNCKEKVAGPRERRGFSEMIAAVPSA
ncbi:MAG: hypothetical protein PHP59_04295 [Methanofollis sp.]|uniref:hypothetical protein n=1 Tax=Methanofollis sp. TaxID=2052835 RepID=UPI002618FAA4|nr:hypothetical protein [Methanofollis sp.]MDD4254579.1 hypothetical protein [Methanofollis sp.]